MISDKGILAGAEDVSHPVFSIEAKHGKSVLSAFLRKAYEQCVKNAPQGKVPLVVLHPAQSKHYYAFLDLEDLMELLGDDFADRVTCRSTGTDMDLCQSA